MYKRVKKYFVTKTKEKANPRVTYSFWIYLHLLAFPSCTTQPHWPPRALWMWFCKIPLSLSLWLDWELMPARQKNLSQPCMLKQGPCCYHSLLLLRHNCWSFITYPILSHLLLPHTHTESSVCLYSTWYWNRKSNWKASKEPQEFSWTTKLPFVCFGNRQARGRKWASKRWKKRAGTHLPSHLV